MIVGSSSNTFFDNHCFVRFPNGSILQMDVSGAKETSCNGINDKGDVVGTFEDTNDDDHGFLCPNCVKAKSFTQLDFPGSTATSALGINNLGEIVGSFNKSGDFAFYRSPSGFYTKIKFPAASSTGSTVANGINNLSQIVGQYEVDDISTLEAGFLLASPFGIRHFTKIAPLSSIDSGAFGINDSSVIVGTMDFPSIVDQGYEDVSNVFTPINPAGSTNNDINGINNKGVIVGATIFGSSGTLGLIVKP